MSNEENPLQTLTQWFFNGKINDEIYNEAKKQSEILKTQQEQRKKDGIEKARKKNIEDQKPENRLPFFDRNRGSKEIVAELYAYVRTYDLDTLMLYHQDMLNGKNVSEYESKIRFDWMLNFLSQQLTLRKSKLNPVEEKNRLLREAKVERGEIQKQLVEIAQKAEKAKEEIDSLTASHTTTKTQDKAVKEYTR
jgi:hypothetical protein